jgi:hypothetical protein
VIAYRAVRVPTAGSMIRISPRRSSRSRIFRTPRVVARAFRAIVACDGQQRAPWSSAKLPKTINTSASAWDKATPELRMAIITAMDTRQLARPGWAGVGVFEPSPLSRSSAASIARRRRSSRSTSA